MVDLSIYVVTQEIAIRSGVIETHYRTKDGRFILNSRDLSRIRLVGDEFVNGLDGVESITEQEADRLISEGGFKMGLPKEEPVEEQEQTNVETISEEEGGSVEDVVGDLVNEETESETNNEEE
jgi:hypothetical protein